jgi:hypothetical protein
LISVGSEVQVLPGPPSGVGADHHRGDIAQLVEHLLCKQGVTGSNPVVSIIRRSAKGGHGREADVRRIIPRRELQGSAYADAFAKRAQGDNPPEGASRVRLRRTRPRSGREVIIPRREQNLSAAGGHDIVPDEAPALKPNCFAERSRVRVDGSPNENHRHVGRHSTGDFVV